jgi:hypothetical protein
MKRKLPIVAEWEEYCGFGWHLTWFTAFPEGSATIPTWTIDALSESSAWIALETAANEFYTAVSLALSL